jgi:CheY-like chemotaxis protein
MMKTVLIIDDEDMMVRVLKRQLANDYEVSTARSKSEALEYCRDTRPDCVLVDWFLPDVQGPELIGALRQVYPDVPIVAMSGQSEIVQWASEQGVQGVLEKPFDRPRLIEALRAALSTSTPREPPHL